MRRLIIRPGAIGDCLLAWPALQHLKAEYTEVWISSPLVPLIDFADRVQSIASTGIDLLGLTDEPLPALWRERFQQFDSIVSWYGSNRVEFRNALHTVHAGCQFHRALPLDDGKLHATDFFAQQVGAPMGLETHITVPKVEPRGTIIIHPFSGSARKNWPLEHFEKLAELLPLPSEWIDGPEDLGVLAARLAGAALYVGNDTGPTHLAAAVGLPTLALFGPTDPGVWAPRSKNVSILRWEPIATLTVQIVLERMNQLLSFRK